MREIKFRAYNTDLNKMVYPNENGWFERLFISKKNNILQSVQIGIILDGLAPEVEVMQYTGLKDKNGVEVYEGDIVHFTDFDTSGGNREDREHIGIVKYQSGIYEIWKNNDSEYYGSDGAFILNHAWLQDDEFEVIGNIYENPVLLEVEANA